jgi:DNA-directed RNA polymerase subunit omega
MPGKIGFPERGTIKSLSGSIFSKVTISFSAKINTPDIKVLITINKSQVKPIFLSYFTFIKNICIIFKINLKEIIVMSIPLATLEDNKKNVYELTCAAIKRAKQIAITGDEELEDKSNKITSISLDQVLSQKTQYKVEN